jgi:hypothetical protein
MHIINLVFPQTTVKIVPGPGAYVNKEAIELNPMGQYHLSNHRNSKAKTFNPPRSQRFYKSSMIEYIQQLMYQDLGFIILRMTFPMKESTCCRRTSLLGKGSSWMEEDFPLQNSLLRDHSVYSSLI